MTLSFKDGKPPVPPSEIFSRRHKPSHLLGHLRICVYTQIAYTSHMEAIFKELSAFEANRVSYMDDDQYSSLQQYLLKSPRAGDVIAGTGGLRKLRWADPGRSKGKRGGLRIIYYWYDEQDQF